VTWTLHLGDCLAPDGLASLADKSVDHVITDPPYSEYVEHGQAVSGRRTGQAVVRKEKIGVSFLTDRDIEALCDQFVRVARRWIVVFCAWEQAHRWAAELSNSGGRYIRTCAWEKPDATPQLTGDRPATWGECMVVGYATAKGRMSWNGGGKRGLYKAGVCRGAERSEHPTQKPLSLMSELISDFTSPGETVLDPFAGSGTTLVSAQMLGRDAIGWERDEKFHAIATRRLSGDRAILNPSQPELFGAGSL